MSEATKNLSLSFLGAGSMNGAILRGIIASGHDPQLITATVRSDNRAAELRELGINVLVNEQDPEANKKAAASADIIFLGVKPVGITQMCEEISPSLDASKVVVSVAAAITLSSMQAHLPADQPVIRSMPNTPLMVGAGVVGISPAASVSEVQTKLVIELLSGSGDVHVIDEEQQNALSAISGSGPAYAFYLAEAMANAGVAMGLDEKLSIALARATVAGAGKMLADPEANPAALRKAVTSPKGTTEQAIATFDEQGIPKIIAAGTQAAAARAAQLSAELG
ncbi:pyrroline-5-carboxylate reductase [Glutamicibacter arilaitensis]|uniref:Pyrroline-5-carboxylate reductase n=2 Tax=Glutamicibacter arilaitensis TaxID=256701 RepID=A0A2N7S258_9MICC|nr:MULTISPECIES: pyrroline-5-carboxylate reductase [Glutamicibacter]PMQ20220.1 pyrroline-5-carboxylate reductase [Glutamicibacter arilaitensis]CBT76693.1 pyrroline-5-carboxylate reductase [Glutamicibacter arilaitensis Re117]HCH46606.1 pyrroline-5-carboxylate reductase [Glutamicibacter sp.]HCJ53463.1 pyrroline-5-carboxylate reductase [Glutamicibacter sp.]HCM93890.1 pyrroline-5-carboxylate reductase [Glutamicibacter sp.]